MGNSARNVSLVSKPGPAVRFLSAAVGITLALLPAAIHAADAFAPAGAKAMLSVDYIYESAGKKSSEGMYDPHEWNVKRSASLVANLGAQAATEIPTLQPIDAAQTAELEKKTAKAAQSAATQMAPMMADAEKIMARCGDDEACITREVQKMDTLTVRLPVPMFLLPYTETITTDEPAGTYDTPTPKGPQKKMHHFRVNTKGGVTHDKPFTVPLKGGWRSQSGEQVLALKGEFGDAGKLTVRWRFVVQ